MDLDETWQVGLRPEKTKLFTLQRNRVMDFAESAKKWVAEALFFVICKTHHFCHFSWINFRQTSQEHVTRWWLATYGFTFQKSFH